MPALDHGIVEKTVGMPIITDSSSLPTCLDEESCNAPDSPSPSRDGIWTRRGLTPMSFANSNASGPVHKTKKSILPRHLNMIAIGGCVGAGMFVGSGTALASGGPLGLLIG
jgi:amino acid permease